MLKPNERLLKVNFSFNGGMNNVPMNNDPIDYGFTHQSIVYQQSGYSAGSATVVKNTQENRHSPTVTGDARTRFYCALILRLMLLKNVTDWPLEMKARDRGVFSGTNP